MRVRVSTVAEAKEAIRGTGPYGFDIEATSLDIALAKTVTVQLYDESQDTVFVVPVHTKTTVMSDSDRQELVAWLPTLEVKGHNLQYDLAVCWYEFGAAPTPVGDTFLMARVLQLQSQGLKDIALALWPQLGPKIQHLDSLVDLESLTPDSFDAFDETNPEMLRYMALDAYLPIKIEDYYFNKLYWGKYQEAYKTEINFLKVVVKERATGIQVDRDLFLRNLPVLEAQISDLTQDAFEAAGRPFKINSPKDLQRLLFEELNLTPSMTTAKGNPSTSAEALETMADMEDPHPILRMLVDLKSKDSVYRSALKVPSYLDCNDRVHPTVEQIGYDGTARVYTSDPSVNQWPWEVRKAVVPRQGYKFIFFDWSAAELVLAAYWAGCKELTDRYEAGEDLHRFVAAEILGKTDITKEEREVSKVVVFATIFGSEGAAVDRALHTTNGAAYVQRFLERFPEITALRNKIISFTEKHGSTRNYFDRLRKLPLIFSDQESEVKKAKRQAFNTAIQGGVADCMKRAVAKLPVWQAKGVDVRYVVGVFDSFLLEVPESMTRDEALSICRDLSDMGSFTFRFKLGEGKSWWDAHQATS